MHVTRELPHGARNKGVGQASRAHIFAESAAQNPYIFRITGLRVYRPAGTAGVNLNKVRRWSSLGTIYQSPLPHHYLASFHASATWSADVSSSSQGQTVPVVQRLNRRNSSLICSSNISKGHLSSLRLPWWLIRKYGSLSWFSDEWQWRVSVYLTCTCSRVKSALYWFGQTCCRHTEKCSSRAEHDTACA